MCKCADWRLSWIKPFNRYQSADELMLFNVHMGKCVNVRIGAFRGLSPLEGINLHIYQSAHSHINHVPALLRCSTWHEAQRGGVLWESTCP